MKQLAFPLLISEKYNTNLTPLCSPESTYVPLVFRLSGNDVQLVVVVGTRIMM